MPSVEQYDWDKLRPKRPDVRVSHGTVENADNILWRYKKQTPPESTSDKHGEVINALKCSKCEYVATSRANLNDHWLLEH